MRSVPPGELLVYDSEEQCPYLPTESARMPLRMPRATLDGPAFDDALARGDRRCGKFLYRPQCPRCQACEPLRIPVADFRPHTTQRRIQRRGDRLLRYEIVPPEADKAHVLLFNRHRIGRSLSDTTLDVHQYEAFLVETCCDTVELRFWYGDRLIGVAVADRGKEALSAVYCYYDPEYAHLSPGTYSILTQIALCREWSMRYLYLGLYVAANSHMRYKAQFLPHQRLIQGEWRVFASGR